MKEKTAAMETKTPGPGADASPSAPGSTTAQAPGPANRAPSGQAKQPHLRRPVEAVVAWEDEETAAREGTGHDGAGMMRWLLTYADLITLLMAFFVVLYAMSRVDLKKYERLASSLYLAFGSGSGRPGGGSGTGGGPGAAAPGTATSPEPPPEPPAESVQPLTDARFAQLARQVNELARELEASGLVQIRVADEGLSVVVADRVLFPSGQAELQPEARAFLSRLAPLLRNLPNAIQIRGHTDDRPIRTPEYPSNWELSLARAVNVLRYLVQAGIPGERLSAAGFGATQPVASNETEEGRLRNRRVEIVVLQLPSAGTSPAPAAPGSAD